MKNKPLRHKEYNTFKFQPFADRIANINVDVFHKVLHKYEERDANETDTFFYNSYRKWNNLNKSENYHLFKNEIDLCSIKTLPELLLQKERVIDVLLKYLELSDPLSLQAFLELVVALSKDLMQDFYVYYPQFHLKLIKLLNTKDADQLEWTFTCLAYLFKSLWRYIIKDLPSIFDSLLPLLSNSKPEYINNFAADSFAFVARKVKDRRSFLKLILSSIYKTTDGVSGYGRLLCASVCSVCNQFHSCARPFLNFLLKSLVDEKLQRNLLFQVLDNMVQHMTNMISPQHSQLFWTTAQDVVDEFYNDWKENPDEKFVKGLHFVLQLVLKVLKWRDAAWLSDSQTLLKCSINLLQSNNEKLQVVVVDIVSVVLTSPRILLTQEQSSFVINQVLSISNRFVIKGFIEKTIKYSGFDSLILRRFIRFSLVQHPNDTLNLWTKIILFKAPPNVLDSPSNRYVVDFGSNASNGNEDTFCKLLLNELSSGDSSEELINNMEKLISVLLVLPHFEELSVEHASDKILNLIKAICNALQSHELLDSCKISKLLFILLSAIKCFTLIKKFKNVNELNVPDVVVRLLTPFIKMQSHQLLVLHCLRLCFDDNKELFRDEIRNLFWDDLVISLSSPYHQVRLSSANLLLKLVGNEEDVEIERCLSFIVKAESLPVTVHDYREILKIISKIECCPAILESKYKMLPLYYLLGILYVNFKLVWEPVTKLIASYAIQLPKTEFWPVFYSRLVFVKEQIKNRNDERANTEELLFENSGLSQFYNKINALGDKPDHWNYRNMLWKAMPQFSDVCESKNRDIVPLFFTFLDEEYYRMNADIASNWNIKLKIDNEDDQIHVNEEPMEVDDKNEEVNETNITDNQNVSNNGDDGEKIMGDALNNSQQSADLPKFTMPGKSATKSLLSHICIFGKIRDPKSLYKEAELRLVYYELLTHKNPEVQKSALECIMTYKYKYVSPYREHLFGLIDDKSFKDEIVLFRIDQESDVVRPEHRKDLMPIVMRILYSKMLNKSGARTGSKSAGQLRRSLVLRFLAGCHPDEIMMYLQMAFRIYTPFIKDDPMQIVKFVDSSLDIGSMIPPRRLQSSVNLLVVVLTQCGGLMTPPILSYLLRILFSIGQIVACALKQRESIHPGYITTLRIIRNSCLDALSKFFSLFESYPWSPEELDTVFEVFVWPWLPKLPVEGVHSPTSLLKLFIVWSKFQRYFPLLGKRPNDINNCVDPLESIMELLVGAKTHHSVCSAILEMVERLLTLQDFEEECANANEDVEMKLNQDSVVVPLVVNNAPVFNRSQSSIIDSNLNNLNYGSHLILKHIPAILERLKVKLSRKGGDCRLRKYELTILSRVTELVSDPATSDTLLSLILPIMIKKAKASDDVVCPILNTLYNLIGNVCDPGPYVYKLAPLFGIVSTAESRKLLTKIVIALSKKETEINEELIEDLNAFDKRWLEQPDFNRRLDAFKRIKKDVESDKLSLSMGIIIIYNCFFFLKSEKDLSIRDNAAQCLRHLCPALCLRHKCARDLLLEQTILPLISLSIRDKKCDIVQQEAVVLLGYMVRECSEVHPILKDLLPLGNKLDMEVDFFENLHHLQLHRRVRALLKLSDVISSLKKSPTPRSLTQFLLPLVTQFLCEENYLNKNTIVDAAIRALETICKLLSWHQYELILRYYLGKLQRNIEFQKQLVRVIVSVLNGFHFDLSKASLSENNDELKMDHDNNGVETYDREKESNAIKENDGDDDEADENETELLDETEKEEKEFEENLTKVTGLDEEDEESIEIEKPIEEVNAVDKITVLNKSSALRVIRTIKNSIFVQLLKAISMRSQSDVVHKLNRKQLGPDRDEEDVLRIPIALAAVKLLQRLPAEFLEQNLSGILMKLCTFLKSRLDSVRRVTRETLQKVMISLGPDYLPTLIREMTELLTKGFHVHVLIYTLHSVLVALKDLFQPGHLDKCLQHILEVCKLDLFGNASEEKEVAQIAGRLMEARANKSYDVFHILGEFLTENCLLDLVMPLKEELHNSLSHKVVRKVTECLRQIVLGLVDNKFVSVESVLIFAYGVSSESIPSLAAPDSNSEESENKQNERPHKPTDTFIIPEDPKGCKKVQTKQCAKTNAHVLVEFGLQLYHFLLKRERVKSEEYKPHLDPVVSLMQSCLQSQHMKINSLAIQCLCWILKKNLPSLKVHIKQIMQTLFAILHKYASAGLSKGDNFDLVMAAFKAVSVIVRDVRYYQLERDQLQALLLYCEQDIHDSSRQATAFTLLKSILGRKLNIPELHEVISKVEELTITSHLDHSRLQARQIVHQFMSEYKLGKKLSSHLNFYITHLDYDLQTGRESALEMLHSLINTLPEAILKEQSGLLFVSIAVRLVNEDVPECRQKAAEVITSLLQRANKNEKNNLFDIVLLWLKDKKVAHRRLGAQLCGIFVTIEQSDFENNLPALIPVILQQFYEGFEENKPGMFVRITPNKTDGEESTVSTMNDHHLYQLLNTIVKVMNYCPKLLTDPKFTSEIETIADNSQRLLAHPHEWVRLSAAQLLGRVISVLKADEIAGIANGDKPERPGFFMNETRERIKSFALDHCYQLSPGVELHEKLLMQCMKNLVYVGEILQHVKSDVKEKGKPPLSLPWLVRHMRKLVHMEVAQTQSASTVVRTMVFHWIAAIALKLPRESLLPVAAHLMAPLVREMNIGDDGDVTLTRIAKEAAGYVKRKIGLEEYNRLVTNYTTQLNVRRAQRKKDRAQQAITDPEKAAKRKIMKQQKKKVMKKRKVEAMKKHKLKRKVKGEIEFGGD